MKRKRLINRSKSRKKHKLRAKKLDFTKLRKWSLLVRKRDNFTCVSCGSISYTHAHHMVSKYYRPKYAYVINNGITLCKSCHLGDGGVHDKTLAPKNSLIKRLKIIFKLNDIKSSLVLGQQLDIKSKPTTVKIRKKGSRRQSLPRKSSKSVS